MPDVSCVCQPAASSPSVWSVVVPVATVLVAAVVAVITYKNTTRQLAAAKETARMNLVMPMREAWITKLREKIAWYMGTCTQILVGKKVADQAAELIQVRHEVQLMLNQREQAHADLDRALTDLVHASTARPRDDARFDTARDTVTACAHDILRSEWERTKAGG